YRDSVPASAAVAAMNFYSRSRRVHDRSVDMFIALSRFARSKYAHAGLVPERIAVKPNFLANDPGVGSGAGGYAIFVGRLSPEKGVTTLLDAWSRIGQRMPLKVVRDGPMASRVQEAVAGSFGAVEWLGRRTQ